jgi:hypothetical protein
MEASKRRNPQTAANSLRANSRKQHTDITASWLIREVTATVSIGLLVSVILWSCILGMSGNMGPGKGVVFGPIAEASDDE